MPASEMRFEPEGHFMAAMLDMREMLIKLRNKAKQGYLVTVTDKDIQDGCYGVPLGARLTPPELARTVVEVRGGYSLNEQLLAD
jgi:hypothetical protein